MDSVTASELNRETAKVVDRVRAGESTGISLSEALAEMRDDERY
jgi:antitoxin (DNA-binding transcriptional repressor) of toxin-antitoxin stability system